MFKSYGPIITPPPEENINVDSEKHEMLKVILDYRKFVTAANARIQDKSLKIENLQAEITTLENKVLMYRSKYEATSDQFNCLLEKMISDLKD